MTLERGVPLQTVLTNLLITLTCAVCGGHIIGTSPKIYTACAFCLLYAAGFAESLGGSVVWLLEDEDYHLGSATSVPNLLFDACILVESLASLLLAAALLEYIPNHWLGNLARQHRVKLALGGAAFTAAMLAVIVLYPSYYLAMYLSIPCGIVFVASLVLVYRASWHRRSLLAWLHMPVMWTLAGMIVLLVGTGESALAGTICGHGGHFEIIRCPYMSKFFDPQTVYNLVCFFGYSLMWVGAHRMCNGHKANARRLPAVVQGTQPEAQPLISADRGDAQV